MLDDNTYKVYDSTVSFLMSDVLERTKGEKVIGLAHFDIENHDHLTILWAAMYVASFGKRKVALNIGLWKYLKFRLTHREMRKWYCRKSKKLLIDVPSEIDEVYECVEGANILVNGIGCIYDEYYAPKKGK